MAEQVIFLLLCAVILVRGVALSARGRAPQIAVSLIFTLVYLTCLWVPAQLQRLNISDSKIAKAGILSTPTSGEIASLCLRWSLELLVVFLVEFLIGLVLANRSRPASQYEPFTVPQAKYLSRWLVVIGFIASVLLPSVSLENRAAGGQGIATLLKSCLYCGLAIICYYNFFKSWWYRAIVIGFVGFLVFESVRSPLLVLLVAYLGGLIARDQLKYRMIAIIASVGAIFSLAAAVMSNVRANELRSLGYSTSQVVVSVVKSPLKSVYESGLDTLDGYRLSMILAQKVDAHPFDVVTIFTNFVPRLLWPSKPVDFTVSISERYLGYGASGQYLSPVGYLDLAYGSYFAAIISLVFVYGAFAILVQRFGRGFWLTIALCVVVRFSIGGSSFDLYYCITLIACIAGVRMLLRFAGNYPESNRWKRRKDRRTSIGVRAVSSSDYLSRRL